MDFSASSSVQIQTNVIESVDEEMPTTSRSQQIESIHTEIRDSTSQIVLDEPIDIEMSTHAYTDDENCPEFDVGKWLGKASQMTTAQKSELLHRRWKPTEGYNFRDDVEIPSHRKFIHK